MAIIVVALLVASAAIVWILGRPGGVPASTPMDQAIHGVVRDRSGAPIAGATIEACPFVCGPNLDLLQKTISDAHGAFKLERLAAGRYSLIIRRQGFDNSVLPNVEAGAGVEAILTVVSPDQVTPGANP